MEAGGRKRKGKGPAAATARGPKARRTPSGRDFIDDEAEHSGSDTDPDDDAAELAAFINDQDTLDAFPTDDDSETETTEHRPNPYDDTAAIPEETEIDPDDPLFFMNQGGTGGASMVIKKNRIAKLIPNPETVLGVATRFMDDPTKALGHLTHKTKIKWNQIEPRTGKHLLVAAYTGEGPLAVGVSHMGGDGTIATTTVAPTLACLVDHVNGDDVRAAAYNYPAGTTPGVEFSVFSVSLPSARFNSMRWLLTLACRALPFGHEYPDHVKWMVATDPVAFAAEIHAKIPGTFTNRNLFDQTVSTVYAGIKPPVHCHFTMRTPKSNYDALLGMLKTSPTAGNQHIYVAVREARKWLLNEIKSRDGPVFMGLKPVLRDCVKDKHDALVKTVLGPLMVWAINAVVDAVDTAQFGTIGPLGDSFTVMAPTDTEPAIGDAVATASARFMQSFDGFYHTADGGIGAIVNPNADTPHDGDAPPIALETTLLKVRVNHIEQRDTSSMAVETAPDTNDDDGIDALLAAAIESNAVDDLDAAAKSKPRRRMVIQSDDDDDDDPAPDKPDDEEEEDDNPPPDDDPDNDGPPPDKPDDDDDDGPPLGMSNDDDDDPGPANPDPDPDDSGDDDDDDDDGESDLTGGSRSSTSSADEVMIITELKDVSGGNNLDYETFITEFRSCIIRARHKFTESQGDAIGTIETWVKTQTPKTSRDPRILDEIGYLFKEFSERGIGAYVPNGTAPPAHVLHPDRVTELHAGKFYPRVIAFAQVSDAPSSKGKSLEELVVQSEFNMNHWVECTTSKYYNGLPLIEVINQFWLLLKDSHCFLPEKPSQAELAAGVPYDVDQVAAFIPKAYNGSDGRRLFTSYITGSDSGDGKMSSRDLDIDGSMSLRRQPLIQRLTIALPGNKVLAFSNDKGARASTLKIIDADGKSSCHRALNVPIDLAQTIVKTIRGVVKLACSKKFEGVDDIEHNAKFHAKIIKPLIKILVEHADKVASIMYTQLCRSRMPEDTAWTPAHAGDLTQEENICALVNLAMMVRPWANADVGQQLTSLLGAAGGGKSSFVKAFLVAMGNSFITMAKTDEENTFAKFYDKWKCFAKGVFPYTSVVLEDHKNLRGAQMPKIYDNKMLGEEGKVTVAASDKYRRGKDVEATGIGAYDTGNELPDDLAKDVEEGKITPQQAAIEATAGGGGQGERRSNLLTPHNRIVDSTLSKCAITKPYFTRFSDIANDHTCLFTILVLGVGFNLIARKLGITNTNTALHNAEMATYAAMDRDNINEYAKTLIERTTESLDIPVVPELPDNPFTIVAHNVIPLKQLLEQVKAGGIAATTTKDVATAFPGLKKNNRCYGCKQCGIAFVGKRIVMLAKLQIYAQNNGAANPELKTLMESACVVSASGNHEWGFFAASPLDYRLGNGAPPVA